MNDMNSEGNALKKMQILEILEIESQKKQALNIKSKRALQVILKLEEIDWKFSDIQSQ